MANDQNRPTLQQYVEDMVALESQIEAMLARSSQAVMAHPSTTAAVGRFHLMVKGQRDALRAHLQSIGSNGGSSANIAPTQLEIAAVPDGQVGAQALSMALQDIYATFNRAAFGYAMLHARAHRFFDRATADLAEQHLRGYAEAAQAINRLIADVVVWELYQAGQECQCQCPSCGLGVCVCAPHGTETIELAWRETSPSTAEAGVSVRPPRANSAAAQANLRE